MSIFLKNGDEGLKES